MTTLTATQPSLTASGRKSSTSSHADEKDQITTPAPAVAPVDQELTKLRVSLILIMTGMLMFLVGE